MALTWIVQTIFVRQIPKNKNSLSSWIVAIVVVITYIQYVQVTVKNSSFFPFLPPENINLYLEIME